MSCSVGGMSCSVSEMSYFTKGMSCSTKGMSYFFNGIVYSVSEKDFTATVIRHIFKNMSYNSRGESIGTVYFTLKSSNVFVKELDDPRPSIFGCFLIINFWARVVEKCVVGFVCNRLDRQSIRFGDTF